MTRRLRRVLALLPGAALGGAEAQTATLLRALAATGIEVAAAIAPALAPGFAARLGPSLGAAVRPAAIGWDAALDPPTALGRQRDAAAAILAALRPEVALLPLPWPTHGLGIQAALAAAAIPALAIAHLAPRRPEPVAAAVLGPTGWGPTVWGPTVWGAVSAPVADRLAATFGLRRGDVAVVPNGVAVTPANPARVDALRARLRGTLGLPGAARVVLAVGRLEPNKGADLLPPLAAALHAATGATLVALGEGPLGAVLAAHPAAQGPTPALRLIGQVGDAGDWMLAADALVLPSRLEGCPLVFLEAAARRLPVVASAAALEAWGDAAPELARVIAQPSVPMLAAALRAALTADAATGPRVAAAHAFAEAQDEAAMLAGWFGLLRMAA